MKITFTCNATFSFHQIFVVIALSLLFQTLAILIYVFFTFFSNFFVFTLTYLTNSKYIFHNFYDNNYLLGIIRIYAVWRRRKIFCLIYEINYDNYLNKWHNSTYSYSLYLLYNNLISWVSHNHFVYLWCTFSSH